MSQSTDVAFSSVLIILQPHNASDVALRMCMYRKIARITNCWTVENTTCIRKSGLKSLRLHAYIVHVRTGYMHKMYNLFEHTVCMSNALPLVTSSTRITYFAIGHHDLLPSGNNLTAVFVWSSVHTKVSVNTNNKQDITIAINANISFKRSLTKCDWHLTFKWFL